MASYDREKQLKSSLSLMGSRMGVFYRQPPSTNPADSEDKTPIASILDPALVGVNNQRSLLEYNGGTAQQERMILDKRRSLDRAVLYSYQGALVKDIKAEEDDKPVKALINPNKNKVDYDDKIISVEYEYGLTVGSVFEWLGTKTYWLIYLQDLTELAYFRGDIRRCSYEISWEDEDGSHSTYAAVRGPVETKINYIQKHLISVDEPNYSLHILMPRTEEALKYFRRYSKFYLKGESEGSPTVCWRVEATDWISTPGILELTAVEYYSNTIEDDIANGIVGGLIAKTVNPNSDNVENVIVGETFIKPKITYTYEYKGPTLISSQARWKMDKQYPVEVKVDETDKTKITIKWTSNYSGTMKLSYGPVEKTIVVESLF